ncbi:MAG TPA: hypothetical protein EYN91_12180 [Candidatus Melainabacteria bacterium]|nr:hypothetical protein [Candidatus Melainabacteria bacterium]HIN66592.1 hypothetical protein [Candidatus Obscuribacterales bacterium]
MKRLETQQSIGLNAAIALLLATIILPLPSSAGSGRGATGGAPSAGGMARGFGRAMGNPHVQNFGSFPNHRRGAFFPYVWYGYQYPVPVQTEPDLPEVFAGMRKKLSESGSKREISRNEFAHLNQRLSDLKGKAQSLENAGGGYLDAGQEEDMRRDLKQLQDETDRRSKGK